MLGKFVMEPLSKIPQRPFCGDVRGDLVVELLQVFVRRQVDGFPGRGRLRNQEELPSTNQRKLGKPKILCFGAI